MRRTHARSSHPAFTLIELLVVVSIIALLISILLPSLKKARTQAKNTKCAAQLHDIGVSLMSYNYTYTRFPHQNSLGDAPRSEDREAPGFWSYTVHKEIAENMGGMRLSADGETRTRAHPVFYCPFIKESEIYSVNQLSGRWPDGSAANPGDPSPMPTEDAYIHIGYFYAGALQDYANDPDKSTLFPPGIDDAERNRIKEKRRLYVKYEPDSTRVLMADMVMLWNGGTPRQWRINHGAGWGAPFGATSSSFRPPNVKGANELFGDAHVDWKGPAHFRELTQVGMGSAGYSAAARGATFHRSGDMTWW
jgi:prepilin-type N-terminal cleavage/methylation domain-containing protein